MAQAGSLDGEGEAKISVEFSQHAVLPVFKLISMDKTMQTI